jgi:MFS transporter, PHS family, inorganic phosphate transporter
MSAIIGAEYVSTDTRATTISLVFLMQSFGRMLAFGLGDAFLQGQARRFGVNTRAGSDDYKMKFIVDQTWRFVTGLGGVFAVTAIVLRLTIPEAPRYYVRIGQDLIKAMTPNPPPANGTALSAVPAGNGTAIAPETGQSHHGGGNSDNHDHDHDHNQEQAGHPSTGPAGNTVPSNHPGPELHVSSGPAPPGNGLNNPGNGPSNLGPPRRRPDPQWAKGAWIYWRNPTGRRVFMMCALWFALDVCFYGTGLDSPPALNALWLTSPPQTPPTDITIITTTFTVTNTTTIRNNSIISNSSTNFTRSANSSESSIVKFWEIDPYNNTASIYEILYNDGTRSLQVYSITSLVGSIAVIPLLNCVSRRRLLFLTSSALAVVFWITGALVLTQFAKQGRTAILVFYAIAQFLFNLGPNTVIFIMAAEVFPTMVRGTFFGLAAASGKAAAMLVRPAVSWASAAAQVNDPRPLAGLNFGFGVVMLLIALAVAKIGWFDGWLELPEVQEPRKPGQFWLKNRPLEDIAPNPGPGQLILGYRNDQEMQVINHAQGPHAHTPQGGHPAAANPSEESLPVPLDDLDDN